MLYIDVLSGESLRTHGAYRYAARALGHDMGFSGVPREKAQHHVVKNEVLRAAGGGIPLPHVEVRTTQAKTTTYINSKYCRLHKLQHSRPEIKRAQQVASEEILFFGANASQTSINEFCFRRQHHPPAVYPIEPAISPIVILVY